MIGNRVYQLLIFDPEHDAVLTKSLERAVPSHIETLAQARKYSDALKLLWPRLRVEIASVPQRAQIGVLSGK